MGAGPAGLLVANLLQRAGGGIRHILDYAALSGARHHVYPQQLLVGDLIDSLRSAGGEP